ncbi:hypothetical protein BGZ99_004929 [Dissophora globulifera]|uniref:Uncharacterized protein n=1 Tax=Dissophora globulifera TaxID=979702 RepID=A0A9P6RXL7_9FUNG|nr:hypothetical protein BGZ99_004929 [Dissophora globulifera]
MGGLSLQCVVANGTRLLGMSYTSRVDDNTSYDSSYVVLIQSNPNPASVDDISWSLVAAYPRLTSYPQDFSPLVCNVDPVTGVFSMMSYFNLTDPTVVIPDQYLLPRRKPGGFQYDPRNNRWSNFTLDPNYRWGDISATYALFQWPNTTTLYQANVGNSTTVNIGLLASDKDDDSKQFVSITSWDLDPSVYGYPSRLFFGNNILYQFGTLVANNKTGALRNTLTRIPLSGDAATFMLPDDLPVYNATALDQCTPSFITANYYKDTLYVFCQGVDTDIEPGVGLVMKFRDGAVRDTALSNFSETDFDRISGASIQPIGGDNNQNRFAFVVNAPSGYSMEGMALDDADLGIVTSVGYYLNITEPYGFSITDPPNHTPAIIGGSVAGVLLLLAIAAYFLVRRRWPQWRRKLRAKIILMMSADDLNENPKFYKFEESSRQSFDSGRDKILVTDDMDLEGIVDVGTGYMQNVTFGQHPRPAASYSATASFNIIYDPLTNCTKVALYPRGQ